MSMKIITNKTKDHNLQQKIFSQLTSAAIHHNLNPNQTPKSIQPKPNSTKLKPKSTQPYLNAIANLTPVFKPNLGT